MPTKSTCFVLAHAACSAVRAQSFVGPMTGVDRLHWLVRQNRGPVVVAEDLLIGAASTLSNTSKEYGPHWDGSNFPANTWMPNSESNLSDAALRTSLGSLSRMGENAYKEFRSRH